MTRIASWLMVITAVVLTFLAGRAISAQDNHHIRKACQQNI